MIPKNFPNFCLEEYIISTFNVSKSNHNGANTEKWIPDIINVNGTASGVSYNRTFVYAGLKKNEIGSRGQDTH